MKAALIVMTILGFSAFWEILEAWVGQIAHPDVERALVGHQGDVWDPQRDMTSALYGSLLCVALVALVRKVKESAEEPLPSFESRPWPHSWSETPGSSPVLAQPPPERKKLIEER